MAMHPENAKERKWLIEALERHLLPSLGQQGFELAPPEVLLAPVDRRYVQAFPFGRMVRPCESGVDWVSIQFATYLRNAFRINARVEPPKKIIAPRNRLPGAAGYTVSGLSEHFEMYSYPKLWPWFTWGWFSVRHWPLRSAVKQDYEKLAVRVSDYVPELDLALRESKLGPHMRRMLLPYYVPISTNS